jgi:hypothetical protein
MVLFQLQSLASGAKSPEACPQYYRHKVLHLEGRKSAFFRIEGTKPECL